MEKGDSISEAIFEDGDLVDGEDVEMLDVEEGEPVVVDCNHLGNNLYKIGVADANGENQGSRRKNKKRRANKRKNKKKKGGSGDKSFDINQFVLDTCRRLKEKKSYMVYTAVGCLGVSALTDLVTEVNAIQSRGGQMTTDGKSYRTGGGILWNILKVREPGAYREIMKRTKDFEKQFRQQNTGRVARNKGNSSQQTVCETTVETQASVPEHPQLLPQNLTEQLGAGTSTEICS